MNPTKGIPQKYVAFLLAVLLVADGCKSQSKESASTTPAPAPQAQEGAAAPAAAAPTTPMSLDDLVAPIALYPDELLGQMLIAAVNSQEVLDLGNWLIQNQSLKPDAAPAAAKDAGFSTSAQYLAAFPQVVDNMCQELDWTKQLGQAYNSDPKGVMAAIQRKRQQAQQVGNLKSSPQMSVDTKTDNGQQVVEIKPADPEVIYVPQYNTTTIYTTPPPAQTTTVVQEQQSGVSTGAAVAIGLLSFGVGMAVGSSFHNNNYYPYPSWGYGGMYYGGRPYYPPPYRPPYYAGYRPAYGYHPPSNYHWNQYNRNVNVNVNNNNYYNRYRGEANRTANPGYPGNNTNRPNVNGGNRPSTGYQGARPTPAGERPGQSMARTNPNGNVGARPNASNERPGQSMARTNPSGNLGSRNPGYSGTSNMSANRAAADGGDRGYANRSAGGSNLGTAQNRSTPQSRPAAQNRGGGAFGGGSGSSERAASNRGHASAGAPQRAGSRPR